MSEYINKQSFFDMLSGLAGLEEKKHQIGKLRVKDVLKLNVELTQIEYLCLYEGNSK